VHNFRFIYDGTNGRISDTSIWNKYSLKAHLDHNLNIPKAIPLLNKEFPFVLVGNVGFPLSTKVLIPYPRDICSGRKN